MQNSLLQCHGFEHVAEPLGGMEAWEAAELETAEVL